jgi:hypothetical protein
MISGATVLALLCSDPRLDPRKMLALDGTHSRHSAMGEKTTVASD